MRLNVSRFLGLISASFARVGVAFFLVTLAHAETESIGDWNLICENDKCQAVQQLFVTTEEARSRVLSASVVQIQTQKVLQLVLPLGLDLRPGIVVRVDESEEQHFPVTTCINDGCVVLMSLTDALYGSLKAGNKMKVGFRPFNSEQTLVVEASLKGFTKASSRVH